VLARLEQRFAFLVSRQRDTPERHRTLRAVIESSYQLLAPELQRCFVQLSVFRGGWTLAAAEALCGDFGLGDGEGTRKGAHDKQAEALPLVIQNPKSKIQNWQVLDYLEQLRDCSLLTVEESGRYRLLETLREFAAEQVTPEA